MEGSATTTLTPVITAMGDLVDIVGKVFTMMLGNPYLVTLMGAGLLAVGIRLFRKAKSAAR